MKRRRTGAELYSHYIRKLQLKHTKRIQKKYNSWYSAISFGLLDNVTRSFAHLHALNCVCRQGALNFTCRKWHSNCNNWAKENCEDVALDQGCPGMIGMFSAMGKASFCEVNYLQMVPNGDEWQGKLMLYITLTCHRTEYHGSSCI